MNPPLIVFAMLQESGHLNPTYALAKELQTAGMSVRYLAIPETKAGIEAQGFDTVPLFPELFPEGGQTPLKSAGVLSHRRAVTRSYRQVLHALHENSGGAAELLRMKPDLILIDVTQTHFAVWARRERIPFVYVNTSLPQTQEPGLPPLRSARSYAQDVLGRLTNRLVWDSFLTKRRLIAELAAIGGMRPPYDIARKAARKFGIGAHNLDRRTAYMPQVRDASELVLCPESFDFPRRPRAGRHYISLVELERKEPAFDWEPFDASKPLVYCALGSQLYRASETPAFFRRLLRVFGEHPEWQLLLAYGNHVQAAELGELPANVFAVQFAPQLQALRRAQVMVTHGGLNSVKECIASGVPMLVFPLAIDQPGNAARVEYHGLGLAGEIARTSEAELAAMLARVIDDVEFARRCQSLKSAWEAERASAKATIAKVVGAALHRATS